MTFQASDIGPKYDVGLSTRDGSTLNCRDRNGNLVPVSMIAYMCSVDKGKTMKESTELQEKSRLTQLGTSTSIDREFDQWVQNTQGDWSAGSGQRIYGKDSIVNQYFDGEGLLWPLNDYLPQKAMPGPTLPLPANFLNAPLVADSVVTTLASAGLPVNTTAQALASFKAATGQQIARVGAIGAFTVGTGGGPGAVTPPYAQPTTAGHLLLGVVGCDSNAVACATPGWVQAVIAGPNQDAAIWYKANCGAGEVAPTFTCIGTGTPMVAMVAEFSGVALVAPLDKTGALQTGAGVNPNTVTAAAADSAFGDLIVLANKNVINAAGAETWADVWNNGVTPIRLGDDGPTVQASHFMGAYGIGSGANFPFNDIIGGFVNNAGQGYSYIAATTGPNQWTLFFQTGDTGYLTQIVTVAAHPGFTPVHIAIGGGFIWVLWSDYPTATNFVIDQYGVVAGALQRIRRDNLGNTRDGPYTGIITATYVANKLYVAIATSGRDSATGTTWANLLYLLDYSAPGAPPGLGAPFALPSSVTASLTTPGTPAFKFTDLAWSGAILYIGVSDGFNASILSLAAPFTGISETAVLPGLANALLCSVGQELFIVGVSYGSSTQVNRLDLFVLNGGALEEFGPVNTPVPLLDSITSPITFGGYAIWAVSYTLPGASSKTITVYAFDVIRSRLFRALTFTDPSFTGVDVFGHNGVAVFGVTTRTLTAGVTFQAQWGIALFSGLISNAAETAREFYWGVVPLTPAPAFNGLLQMGVDIVSGIFDFTASTNKLFRQLVASFVNGLVAGQSTPGVRLNAWFDQDPARLTAAPDFTSSTGVAAVPLPNSLKLPTNDVARKLVYEVITSGGGYNAIAAAWQNAAKLVDVVVQAATGWVWDAVFDLAPGTRDNGNSDYAYSGQSDPTTNFSIDHVVAYNFMRQLWRLKGGECMISLPNGDTYAALIQLEEFESPKPFAVSARSDQPSSLQEIVTVKIREDI